MRRLLSMISFALVAVAAVAADESYVIVKISEMDRSVGNQVMSLSACRDLEKTIQNERKFFPDALRLAAKAWKDDTANKNVAFPAGRLAPRAIVGSPEHFPSQTKADEQLAKYQEREAQKEAREREKTKGKVTKSKEDIEKDRKRTADTLHAMNLTKAKLAELISGKPGTGDDEKKPAVPKGLEKKAEPVKK